MLFLFPQVVLAEPLAPATLEQIALVATPTGPKLPVQLSYEEEATLERIAWCESRNVLTARNPASTAKGKYQFLDGSWKYYGEKHWGSIEGKDVFSEEDQDDLARYVVSINGFTDWAASEHCWK